MSIKLKRNTQQKMVSASGAMSFVVPWKDSFTWVVDELDEQLDEALEALVGTPW